MLESDTVTVWKSGWQGVREACVPRQISAVATLIAAVATTGSLYFSYGMGLYPCDLCWFQRIFMYPLVIVFAIGTIRDRGVSDIGLGLALPGMLVATYHSYLQIVDTNVCVVGGGCATVQYQVGGLSIPNLSLSAFALLVVLSLVLRAVGDGGDGGTPS